jgi:hypothetical protein
VIKNFLFLFVLSNNFISKSFIFILAVEIEGYCNIWLRITSHTVLKRGQHKVTKFNITSMTASSVDACRATASHWHYDVLKFALWQVSPLLWQSASKFRYCCWLNKPVIYPPCARLTIASRQMKTWFIWKQDFIPSLTCPMKMTSCTFNPEMFMTLRKYRTLIREASIKFISKQRIISLMYSSILPWIWLNFMVQYLVFSALL